MTSKGTSPASAGVPSQEVTATPSAGEFFVPAVRSGLKDSDPRWALPINQPILFFMSTTSWQKIDGRDLPRIHMARIMPGINKVDRNSGVGDLIGLQSAWGRMLVPVDIEVEVYGETARGYNRRLETRTTSGNGDPEYHYEWIWRKPRRLGSLIKWDWDRVGYLKFLEMLKDKYLGEPDPSIVEALTEPILREIDALSARIVFDPTAAYKIVELKKLYHIE